LNRTQPSRKTATRRWPVMPERFMSLLWESYGQSI
jgi:hypothetical protein